MASSFYYYIAIIFLIIIVILSIALFIDATVSMKVYDLVSDYGVIISTQGYYSEELLFELKNDLKTYGEFKIVNILYIDVDGEKDPYYEDSDIMNKPLKVKDKIVINVLYMKPPLYKTFRSGFRAAGKGDLLSDRYNACRIVVPIAKTYSD